MHPCHRCGPWVRFWDNAFFRRATKRPQEIGGKGSYSAGIEPAQALPMRFLVSPRNHLGTSTACRMNRYILVTMAAVPKVLTKAPSCGAEFLEEQKSDDIVPHITRHMLQSSYPSGYGGGLEIHCATHAQVQILLMTSVLVCVRFRTVPAFSHVHLT